MFTEPAAVVQLRPTTAICASDAITITGPFGSDGT
jgi:hypothetical protein